MAPAPEDEAAAGGAAAAAVAVAAGPPGDAGPHGGVADVYVARRDAALLRAFVARSKLLNRKVALDKTLERTAALPAEDKRRVRAVKAAERNTADLARLDARQARAAGAQSPAVCAFVTLNSEAAKLDCLRHYGSRGARHWPLLAPQAPEFRLGGAGGHVLRVGPADEPSNVLWENLECPAANRAARRALSAGISLLIIVVSLTVMVSGKVQAPSSLT